MIYLISIEMDFVKIGTFVFYSLSVTVAIAARGEGQAKELASVS